MSSPMVPRSFLTKIKPIWFSRFAGHSKRVNDEQLELYYKDQHPFFTYPSWFNHYAKESVGAPAPLRCAGG